MQREFDLVTSDTPAANSVQRAASNGSSTTEDDAQLTESTAKLGISDEKTVLKVYYKATTPRMLRVAVNGFLESLGVIVQVMEELDVDVLHEKGIEGLEGVQGVEQGLTGSAVGAGG